MSERLYLLYINGNLCSHLTVRANGKAVLFERGHSRLCRRSTAAAHLWGWRRIARAESSVHLGRVVVP